eukprot:2485560-Alexandrium_andersonii.AAC.1
MTGPQVPPRAAAWQSESSVPRARPDECTRAAPSSLRRQAGICAGQRSPGSSGATFFAIQTRRSKDRPSTLSREACDSAQA